MVRARRKSEPWYQNRLGVLRFGFGVFAAILIGRLFILQIVHHTFYEALAQDQHQFSQQLYPERGDILVHDQQSSTGNYPLATNRTLNLLYAVPKDITDPQAVADKLQGLVNLDPETLLARLDKPNDLYEPIQHSMTDEQRQQIEALKIDGLKFDDESTRYYPEKNIGAQMIGFLGNDGEQKVGQYGIEGAFEDTLAGQRGEITAEKDASGQLIATAAQVWQPAIDGSNVLLTIDRTIQFEACRKLDEAVKKHGADSGAVIIMNPKTGAILAMCSAPDYDPNNYGSVKDSSVYLNQATQVPYEPGSVFKPITMTAALNEGAITPETTYQDSGEVKIDSYTIRNSDLKAHGLQSMTEVLEKSLNTGAIFAMRQVGPSTFERYLQAFGFGQLSGIEVDERAGNISTLSTGREIYAATASYGQGITVTPLQLIDAYAAMANGGKLMRPYLVDRVIHPDGTEEVTAPRTIRTVMTPQTSATVSAMMVRVVQNGHGKAAGVPGYFIAGKTGTAQIPDPKTGGYDPHYTIGTFAGFGPVEDPQFVMVTKLVRPRDVQFAESTAAPLFGELAKFVLLHLGVAPSQ